MKTILIFLALVSSAFAQTYALKSPDNSGLYLNKSGSPVFVEAGKDVPAGKESQFYLVDKTVAEGFRQVGWKLAGGKCVPDVVAIPAPTAEEVAAQAEFEAKIAEANADNADAAVLAKMSAVIEDKTASPEILAEAVRILWRDYVRRYNVKPAK